MPELFILTDRIVLPTLIEVNSEIVEGLRLATVMSFGREDIKTVIVHRIISEPHEFSPGIEIVGIATLTKEREEIFPEWEAKLSQAWKYLLSGFSPEKQKLLTQRGVKIRVASPYGSDIDKLFTSAG